MHWPTAWNFQWVENAQFPWKLSRFLAKVFEEDTFTVDARIYWFWHRLCIILRSMSFWCAWSELWTQWPFCIDVASTDRGRIFLYFINHFQRFLIFSLIFLRTKRTKPYFETLYLNLYTEIPWCNWLFSRGMF